MDKQCGHTQHGRQSNLGRKGVADRQHCECCSNDAADQFSMTTGFQSTNAGLCMTFTIEPDEFVQILHNGSAHWVTISTVGCKHPEVKIFDSLYCTLSPALNRQIAALLATKEHKISVHFMDVQMQAGRATFGCQKWT